MFDLYLISILDSICGVLFFLWVCGFIALSFTITCMCLNKSLDPNGGYDGPQYAMNEKIIKCCKPFLWIGLVALVLWTFCPTTKQGYMIYGLGNTVDYAKNNDTAKQLPDKVVLALDKFLEKEINNADNNKDVKDESKD